MFKKNKTIYFSLIEKTLNKIFFFLITIVSLKISDKFYSNLILFFVLASYFYEILSLSIPKIFNNYYKHYGIKKLSILAGFNFYISFLVLIFFFSLIFFNQNFLIKSFEIKYVDIYYAAIILGFSIFLNELINQYGFIKLKHFYIYLYDLLTIIIIFLVIFYIFKNFKFLLIDKFYLIIFYYACIQIFMKFIKFLIFKSDLVLNFNKIIFNFDVTKSQNIFKLIIPISIVSILILSQLNIARFVIISFEDYSNFATFVFHVQVIELCGIFFAAIHQLSDPKIAILTNNQDTFRFKLLNNHLFNIFLSIPPIILIFIFFLINDVVSILGIDIKIKLDLFVVLSINFLALYLFFTIYQFMIMINQRRFLIKVTLTVLFLNVFFSLILINFFSIIGVAVANLISNLFLFFICNKKTNFFYIRKKDLNKILFSIFKFLLIIFFLILFTHFVKFEAVYHALIAKILYSILLFLIIELVSGNKSSLHYIKIFTKFILKK